MENIGKTVTDGFEKVTNGVNDYIRSDKPRTFLEKLADAFVAIVGFILKAFLLVFAIICSPLLCFLVIFFIALAILIVIVMIGGDALWYRMMLLYSDGMVFVSPPPLVAIITYFAGVLVVGIPLFAIVFSILRYVFNWHPMVGSLKWTFIILWIIALIVFLFALPGLCYE
jgi:hypothetical protein